MVSRMFFTGCCPCCHSRYAVPKSPRRTVISPLFSGRLARKIARANQIPAIRTFATAIHDDEFLRHGSDGREQSHTRQHHGHSHSSSRHGRPRQRHDLPWPASANPTPYEIFHQAKAAPYQKARFYDLAKQYHPDLHHCAPAHLHGLSAATLLERYRLIVAANDILSSPEKRRLYDLYGYGWESDIRNRAGSTERDYTTAEKYQAWRRQPGSAANNATWEDWERWRYAREGNGDKQEEQFMSNGGFAVIVLFFVFLGGWGQLTRAGTNSAHILEMQDEHHRTISHTLRQQQSETALLSRQDRVGSFLERREGWGYALPATPRSGHTASSASSASANDND